MGGLAFAVLWVVFVLKVSVFAMRFVERAS